MILRLIRRDCNERGGKKKSIEEVRKKKDIDRRA